MTISTIIDFGTFRFSKKTADQARKYWRARQPDSVLRIELANLKKNIARDEADLEGMRDEFGRGGKGMRCCHRCVFGERWTRVAERMARRIKRANEIHRKLWYDAGNYGPLEPLFRHLSREYGQ